MEDYVFIIDSPDLATCQTSGVFYESESVFSRFAEHAGCKWRCHPTRREAAPGRPFTVRKRSRIVDLS